jgi:putative heme-binding domain-containing protein
LDSLDRHKLSLARILASLEDKEAAKNLAAVFAAARAAADNVKADEELRASAVRLLGRGTEGREADVARLGKLLTPQTPGSVQSAAVDGLARLGEAGAPKLLLAGWKGHAPALRGQVLDVLLSREAWTKDLVAALESGRIAPSEIDAARRQRLISHKDEQVKAAAQRLLSAAADADRKQVLADYQAALTLSGDAARGAPLFAKKCAACHELGKQGKPVGPNLAALTDKSPAALLTAILDPNQAVEPKYLSYTAIATDGRIYVGILVEETGSSITLVDQNGNRHSLLRSQLDELQCSGKSLMPEGVEKELSPQEIADVMAYVVAGGRMK